MTITLPVVLILAIAALVLLRYKTLGFGAFLAVALFGFYLADTAAAASIRNVVTALADAMPGVG